MINKAPKARKVTIDIRVTYKTDENDLEAWLDKYLKDEDATRFVKRGLIINSLMTHYLPLVYEYQGASQEKIRQSLIDADREWQMHRRYLQQRLGIELDSELATVARANVYPVEEQNVTNKPVSSKPQLELVKERKVLEDEEEGEYPDCFKD
ncbi:MAG: hypothetical protein QNJ32_31215 [Xenococcaceae cyanobacterium MO_167.B27]|nr:hypothetical protein [Xenococcaceae cyanobacterium MO_167.B27]